MKSILIIILSGILGTSGMSLVMWLITRSGLANADMVRAVGSIYTRSYNNALLPGVIMHFTAGIIFAFLYVAFLSIFSLSSVGSYIGIGAMIGVFHGLVVSFLLVVLVAEHHPLEQFQKAGSEVAVAHMVGHIIYGLIVGAVIGIAGVRFLQLQ
ncbi:MAG: hypothetical protein L0Y68_05735 [Candidatus Dadabacteria bacterium]|nr:hypothetical protein [Candidatus Dadabacteria bacterium]